MKPTSNHYFTICILFLLSFFLGCGSDEPVGGSVENGNNPEVTSIVLSASSNTASLNDVLSFSVVTNNGDVVTSLAEYYLDGVLMSSNSHTFNLEGTFLFTAIFDGLTSNELTFTITDSNSNELTSIVLSSNSPSYYISEVATFTVTGNDGVDYSADATIALADGTILTGNTYDTTTQGTFTFTATYNSLLSNEKQITVLPSQAKFQKNVLIEDYTGTWCGYCPRVSYGIELAKEATDKAVSVAIHVFDEMEISGIGPLVNYFNPSGGYPFATLNRTTTWSYPEPNNLGQVVNLTNGDADLGLSINPVLNGTTMDIEITAKFGIDYSTSDLKLVVYVLEDDLLYDQQNYTDYYGGASVLANFEHDYVLRASLTDLMGDTILPSSTSANSIFVETISTAVPSNVADSDKTSVVAFIVNGSSNTVINVRSAYFGETQTLQEL